MESAIHLLPMALTRTAIPALPAQAAIYQHRAAEQIIPMLPVPATITPILPEAPADHPRGTAV